MNFRLIALDLDGTLLDDDKQIPPRTLDLLNSLREQGVYITVCTGRSIHSVRPLLENTVFSTHIITDNGGMIVDAKTNETLYSDVISRNSLGIMKKIMEKYGVYCDVTTEKNMYVETLTEEGRAMYREYLMDPAVINDLRETPYDPIKFTIFGQPRVLDDIIFELEKDFGQELMPIRSGEYFIDVVKRGTTKKEGLQKLAEMLNITADEVLAIGNYYNDVEMLQYAGMGIVVENAPDDLKQIADEVTHSNNEEGVRYALEKWVVRYQNQK